MVVLIFCLRLVSAEDYFGFDKANPFNFNKISGFAIASQSSSNDYTSPRVGMANPAAIYCNGLGYDYNIIDTENGQDGVCTFPDGNQCEEWQFLEGLCGQNYSYCALNGYDIITKSDGNNTFSPTYAVCVNKTTGEEVGSVVNLFGLIGKSVMSTENVTGQEPSASTESTFISLPSYFDWRNNNGNWMTGVKDQGLCGACWAFAPVGTFEAEYNIFTNSHANLDLSEEYLITDCLNPGRPVAANDNCGGGRASDSHDYFKSNGVPDEGCLPYADKNCGYNISCGDIGSCQWHDTYMCSNRLCSDRCSDYQSRLFKTDYSGRITSGNMQEIKEKIITNGPVTATMAYGIGIGVGEFDANGIYRCNNNNLDLDHDVILTGWNDAGGYWIVKNSMGTGFYGEPPPLDGYFYVAYGDCGIEKQIAYDAGFNMTDTGDNVHAFYSQPAPASSYPISCLSQSAIWDSESTHGDDSIEEITINNSQCKVVGHDTKEPSEQRRYVGIASIPQSYIPSPPITLWSSWEFRNQSGYCDGPDCAVETFYSPSCSPGYFPVSCLSETDYQIDQGKYGKDDIVGMNITNGQCQVTVFGGITSDSEYYRRTGVVCLPSIKPDTIWGDWSLRNDTSGYHDGPDADVETFYGPTCPSGEFPISCLSESANAESEIYYGEDGILDIRILGGRCVITANDEAGIFEQKRRVATVCLDNNPPTAIAIFSPVSGSSYFKVNVPLNFSVNKPTSISWIAYSLDGKPNITIPGPVNLSNQTGPYHISDGSHIIKVYASDIYNNMGSSSTNFYYCLGDVNGDGKVDGRDLSLSARLFGTSPGHPVGGFSYDNRADINDDGKIDGKDISLIARQFGKGCP